MIDFDTRRKLQETLISINEEMRKIKLHIATKEMLAEEEAVKLNNEIIRLSEDLNTIEKIARERNISLDHEENYLIKSTYRSPTKNYYDEITNSIADFSIIDEDCDEVNSHSITKTPDLNELMKKITPHEENSTAKDIAENLDIVNEYMKSLIKDLTKERKEAESTHKRNATVHDVAEKIISSELKNESKFNSQLRKNLSINSNASSKISENKFSVKKIIEKKMGDAEFIKQEVHKKLKINNEDSIAQSKIGVRKVCNLWNKFKNPRSVLSK